MLDSKERTGTPDTIIRNELAWLRQIAGISRRKRRQSEDIRMQLQQEVTAIDRIQ